MYLSRVWRLTLHIKVKQGSIGQTSRSRGHEGSDSSGVTVVQVPAYVLLQGLRTHTALDLLQGLHKVIEADVTHLKRMGCRIAELKLDSVVLASKKSANYPLIIT